MMARLGTSCLTMLLFGVDLRFQGKCSSCLSRFFFQSVFKHQFHALRSAVALIVLMCSALSLVDGMHAYGAGPNVPQVVLGSWSLVSIYEEDESGEELDRWGDGAHGHFTADASGHFMLQLVGKHPIWLLSPAQLRACGSSTDYQSIGYAGTFLLDEMQEVLTLKIEDALGPGFDKTLRTIAISFDADGMHFHSAGQRSATGSFHAHLVWKRAYRD